MMDALWQELTSGLHDSKQLAHVIIRLVAATLLGAIVGLQRESTRKPAGLRTHILVSLATAAFVISCSSVGMSSDGLSRVITTRTLGGWRRFRSWLTQRISWKMCFGLEVPPAQARVQSAKSSRVALAWMFATLTKLSKLTSNAAIHFVTLL